MYGYSRNTGIPCLRNYNEALAYFNEATPIRGKGTNAGKLPLGLRHRAGEFYMEKRGDAIECYCYRTPVVTFHPNEIIELQSGGWSSNTTSSFISEVLPFGCRISNSKLVVSVRAGDYAFEGGRLQIDASGGTYNVMHQKPTYVHKVDRKQANIVRSQYTDFIKFFNGIMKLREDNMVKEEEYVAVFGAVKGMVNHGGKPRADIPSDVALRNAEQVDELIGLMQSVDPQDRYKACLRILKQWGKRHYWRDDGYSITPDALKRAMNDLIFAKHKDVVFKVEEVEVGTIRKNLWAHLF